MRYSGLTGEPAFALAVTFLITQQDPAGRFGRLATESAALTQSSTIRPGDLDTRLYLPITVNCLWSLAEAIFDDFTLLNSFPRRPAGASTDE
jgi:hypothetical protein